MNEPQKVIILDADDTLLGLHTILCAALNQFTGKNVACDDWSTFNVTQIYEGLEIEDFYNLIVSKELLSIAKPYKETKATLEKLKELGYCIVIISSRNYHNNAAFITQKWFDAHEIPYDRIHISGNGIKKTSYSMIYDNIVLAVDDNIENCEDFRKNGKINNVVLMDQPWNRNNTDFKRIYDIEQILDLI